MAERLFKRSWKVLIGTSATKAIETEDLYIDFEVTKSLAKEPNSATVTVYNLSEANRKAVEGLSLYDPLKKQRRSGKSPKKPVEGQIRVELEAGYEDARSLIFRGDLRRATSTKTAGTWATTIEGEDGGKTYLASRIAQSFPAGTRKYDVAVACAQAMGLGLGGLPSVQSRLNGVYSHGTVAHGWAADVLAGVMRQARIRYSIQNGVVQVNYPGEPTVKGLVVSEATGLVGAPSIDTNGLVEFTTLLLPDIAPGQYVSLKSQNISGTLKIYRVTYSGSVTGSNWYATCSCLQPDAPLVGVD